jgi:hypothetical protein
MKSPPVVCKDGVGDEPTKAPCSQSQQDRTPACEVENSDLSYQPRCDPIQRKLPRRTVAAFPSCPFCGAATVKLVLDADHSLTELDAFHFGT